MQVLVNKKYLSYNKQRTFTNFTKYFTYEQILVNLVILKNKTLAKSSLI